MTLRPHPRKWAMLRLLVAGTALVFPPVFAQDTAEPEQPNKGAKSEKLDDFNVKWSKRVLNVADGVDSFFGNERIEDDAQQTRVTVNLDYDMREGEDDSVGGGISAKISLPQLENRWSLVINGQEDEEDRNLDDDEADRSVALRFDKFNTQRSSLSFDFGVRRPDDKYEVFGRVRHRITFAHEKWVTRVDNKLYYYADFGAEYDGKLDFDRVIPPRFLFRARTRLRWWEDEDECNDAFCPQQHFYLYQRMKSPNHALSYEWSTFFESDPADGSDDYVDKSRLRLRYRHNTRLDWLFVELRPTLTFPRDTDYDSRWSFLIRLEGIFGYRPTWDSLEYGPERLIDNPGTKTSTQN